jgi:hypothetical protein
MKELEDGIRHGPAAALGRLAGASGSRIADETEDDRHDLLEAFVRRSERPLLPRFLEEPSGAAALIGHVSMHLRLAL